MTTASEIYAEAMGLDLSGPEQCHYCGAACGRVYPHPEPLTPYGPARRTQQVPCKRPAGAYMCAACREWQRPKRTASFLGGGFLDGQHACDHSWLVTPERALAVRPLSAGRLWDTLLAPPCRFFLAVTTGGTVPNHLQCAVANDNAVVQASTRLLLTVDNVVMAFTPYDVTQAAREVSGLEPGVRELVRLFGPPPKESLPRAETEPEQPPQIPTPQGGRPKRREDDRVGLERRTVRLSGVGTV